jgi:hypothetical protein
LLHADGTADAQVLRKPTSWAYFRHSLDQMLLFSRLRYRRGLYLSVCLNVSDFWADKTFPRPNWARI